MPSGIAARRAAVGFGRVSGEARPVCEGRTGRERMTRFPANVETQDMKRTRQNPHAMGPAHRGTVIRRIGLRRTAARGTVWALGPLATAVALALALTPAGAAVLWTIASSFVQAVRQRLRCGDGSAFQPPECPPNQDDFDFFTKSGAYVDLRIRADHEALMRDGDRFLADHDHFHSLP